MEIGVDISKVLFACVHDAHALSPAEPMVLLSQIIPAPASQCQPGLSFHMVHSGCIWCKHGNTGIVLEDVCMGGGPTSALLCYIRLKGGGRISHGTFQQELLCIITDHQPLFYLSTTLCLIHDVLIVQPALPFSRKAAYMRQWSV